MAEQVRKPRSGLSGAFGALATKTRDGYSVRLPTEGNRVVTVSSEKSAKVIAEAEALRQKLATR